MPVISKGSRTASAGRIPRGVENVDFLITTLDPLILATAVGDDNNETMMNGAAVELQFRLADPQGPWTTVVAGVGEVRMSSGTGLVNDDPVLDTDRITTGLFGGYVVGREVDDDGLSSQAFQVKQDTTEFQWGLDFSNAVKGSLYDFRVLWTTSLGIDPVRYISMVAPPEPIPGEFVHLWDTFNGRWGVGLAVLPEVTGGATICMISEQTFSRIYKNVPKWLGFPPESFKIGEIHSAWLEITEPQPTVNLE